MVEHIPNGSDDILQAGPPGVNVDSSNSTTATVECAEGTTLGEEDVVFRTESMGSPVQIRDAMFTVTVDIQCGQGSGQIDATNPGLAGVSVSNLTAGNDKQSQTVGFDLTDDLQPDESVTVTLQDVQHQNKLNYGSAEPMTDDSGGVSGTVNNKRYELEFVADEQIDKGEHVTITITDVSATGKHASKESPYDATFLRTDKEDEEPTIFEVN